MKVVRNDVERVAKMVSVRDTEKKGKWVLRIVDYGYNAAYICSICNYRLKTTNANIKYCPNCGARMKGV